MRTMYTRRGTVITALLLLLFVMIVGYAGILAPHRPLFGWFRVVPLDIDRWPGDPVPGEQNVFFVETSCALNDNVSSKYLSESGLLLSPRTACALEAAAAAHPRHTVYYVHTCAVDLELMWQGATPDYALAVLSAPNVYLLPVRFASMFRHSPLRTLATPDALGAAKRSAVRAADLLRFYLLWTYGGMYLDTDVFLLRSFWKDTNFACLESPELVSGSILHFAWEETGHKMAEACLAEVVASDPNESSSSIVTRAMRKICNVDSLSAMTTESCQGFHLMLTSMFYPISSGRWHHLFDEERADEVMTAINNSLAVHTWNHLSADTKVDLTSQQPFAQIARRVCPNLVATIGDTRF